MLVYLRDGSAQTILGTATLRQKLQIKLSTLPSQYSDTGPTSPSAESIMSGAWQNSHWSANFEVTGLKRIGVKTSAQCPCGEADQTSEHYLQSCSLHQQARQQIWPTCVSLKTKLWGSAEDLFLTSRYAALTGERI